ncbi:SUMF1/EgtB/PvdO family nonheme iron enzyme [Desulfobacterales bacterium HSG16]|nr:SUMF1/EgtB/PvdO family nonheme iron enzyme [Desulfobacterales bacterium HSG16]
MTVSRFGFWQLSLFLSIFIIGCSSPGIPDAQNPESIETGNAEEIVFPDGKKLPLPAEKNVSGLAQIFADSTNADQVKSRRIDTSDLQILKKIEQSEKTAQMALAMIQKLAQEQGTGEITLFFPVDSAIIPKNSLEYQRLVRFLDYLSIHAKGRKIIFISIGRASAFGSHERNENLARERASAPVDIIEKYLVNIPHTFFKVYGTGAAKSPENVSDKIHARHQHTRLTALYDTEKKSNETERLSKSQDIELHGNDKDQNAYPRMKKNTPLPFTNSIGMNFVPVPCGEFMMGSPVNETDRKSDELLHKVVLTRGFYIQTTEATQKQWKMIMGNNPSYFSFYKDDYPAEQVSWYDVIEFIDRLNKKENVKTYDLPTEAQWEYACRATSPLRFSFGNYENHITNYVWFLDNSKKKSWPVSQKKPNTWNLYDMHGNLREWCRDKYGHYTEATAVDPLGPEIGNERVARGGGWFDSIVDIRCASRKGHTPESRKRNLGFRLIRRFAPDESECRP